MKNIIRYCFCFYLISGFARPWVMGQDSSRINTVRERLNINEGWRFIRFETGADTLIYDERPDAFDHNDTRVADTRADQSTVATTSSRALKKWILPTANNFIKDVSRHYQRPAGSPLMAFPYIRNDFNDEAWQLLNLPHDWAISAPFYKGDGVPVGGGMGRLPVQGIGWYRRKLHIPASDAGRMIYLDIDGAMSYAMVWLNGSLVGGWPYGYNSFRLDLTPYIKPGADNQLAIRLDNPANSSRWYPGGGIYRNVWITKTHPVHVAQWGSFVKTRDITPSAATIDLSIKVKNSSGKHQNVRVATDVYVGGDALKTTGNKVAAFKPLSAVVKSGSQQEISSTITLRHPLLWQPLPDHSSNMYVALTRLYVNGKLTDEYETPFGIRDIKFDPVMGVLVNGKSVRIQGVNQHHDLGALGAAFNIRAAERQLEMLREMGCNAIRMAHNPPAPELLDLTDRMGFLVIDEIYDNWEKGKTPLDFHLIFPDWFEADTRSFIRRDKNHPSIIAWSYGNEVGEQYTGKAGAAIARQLHDIVRDEDSTRPATASMNYAKPDMPFPQEMDIITLNYQGEGIRDAPAYAHLSGIKTPPLYPAFHDKFPWKTIISSETASALSSRGSYLFPVTREMSAPVSDTSGGNPAKQYVSAYELYTAPFGSSADKVFASQDKHPYVAGEFVWSGWDYLGEPTPYYGARSSYSGIIDLAGFPKDRFYLYQSRWKPDLPLAHILPHWSWPGRNGTATPVHVFTSGDEAELFLNGKSLGRKKKGKYDYRLRWDDVVYDPGTLKVIAYKNGKEWAFDQVETTGEPKKLQLTADRTIINANGKDPSFITVRVLDEKNRLAPGAGNKIQFTVSGDAKIIATDNGDPADLLSFTSTQRNAYFGLALVVVSGTGKAGSMATVTAQSEGLEPASITIKVQ